MRVLFRLFAIFLALLLAGEVFVRALLTMPVATLSDPELGWVYKPDSIILHTSEGHASNRINSMGFNDSEPALDTGKNRIVVLGDSLTESLQVERDRNFTSLAEGMMPCLDVYNAGRSGLSPVHYPAVLSRVARVITPELAVLVISSGDLSGITGGNYALVRDSNTGGIIDIELREKPLRDLRMTLDPVLSRSALATYLLQRLRALLASRQPPESRDNDAERLIPAGELERAREILLFVFRSMNSHTPVAILYLPKMIFSANRTATTSTQSDEFERLVLSVAGTAGISALSATPYLVNSYREHGQPGFGFANKNILSGHLNGLGHEATARALSDLLAAAGQHCPARKNPQQP